MESDEAAGRGRDPLLDSVNVPDGLGYLWDYFWEIRAGADEGMAGVKITWRDLSYWQDVTGKKLDAFEVEAVLKMDGALRSSPEE